MSMMTLDEPWTYRTPLVTINYPAGRHRVKREIHEAAIRAGASEDEDDGDGDTEDGAAGDGEPAADERGPDGSGAGVANPPED